jgi:undecaprenyl-diphosphatase
MQISRNLPRMIFSERARWRIIWLGVACLFAGAFFQLAWEMHEDAWIDSLDRRFIGWVAAHRIPLLNGIAIDLTSLGSAATITIFTLIGASALFVRRKKFASMYLAVGSIGAGLLTALLKYLFQRPRPDVPRLVEVAGYSFPSGHTLSATSFFLLVMFLLWPMFEGWLERIFLVGVTTVVIGCVAGSRVYLGAHYPSDVAAGIFLGASWAFAITGILFSPRITKM